MAFSDQVLRSICPVVGCSVPPSPSDLFPGVRNKAHPSCPTRYTGEISLSGCSISASMYWIVRDLPTTFYVWDSRKKYTFHHPSQFSTRSPIFVAGQAVKGTCSYVDLGCVRSTHVGPSFQVFGFFPFDANA